MSLRGKQPLAADLAFICDLSSTDVGEVDGKYGMEDREGVPDGSADNDIVPYLRLILIIPSCISQ